MRVAFTPEAMSDLVETASYIAEESPKSARHVAAALRARAQDLASMAERFQVIGQRTGHMIRRRVHGSYAIFYYVESTARTVIIARILHSARDHERILFPED